jgi:hypothetical protein
MKRQISFATISTLMLVVVLGLAAVSTSTVQAAAPANQIMVENQNVNSNVVVIDSVTATENGWVVIYKDPKLDSSDIVGHAWVHRGVNPGVKVIVDMDSIGHPPMLWAAFQADNGQPSVRQKWGDGGTNIPGNAAQNGPTAVTAFATTATGTTPAKGITNRITIHNQDISSGRVLVDSVATDRNGWVALYRNPNFNPDEVVGYAPVYRGTNNHVLVAIDSSTVKDLPNLWAQLHVDAGTQNVFEWGNTRRQPDGTLSQVFDDYPAAQQKHAITTSFATTAPAAGTSTAAPNATNQISVGNQALNTGVIVLDTVNAAQNGWVVIYRNPSFDTSDIVGYAPVYQGTNSGVRVTVDTSNLKDQPPMLWAVLHADQGLSHVFEWGYKGRTLSDPPALQKGFYVATSFGTSGP